MRTQGGCALTVRLSWEVGRGHHHPQHTYTRAADVPMAAEVARGAAAASPPGIRLTGAAVSVSGRDGQWEHIDV